MPRASMPRKNARSVGIGTRGRLKVANGPIGEERREQRSERVHLQRDARLACGVGEAGGQPRPRAARSVQRGFKRSRHQMPAVIASGLPDSVPAW